MWMDLGRIILFHVISLFIISGIAKLVSFKLFLQLVKDYQVLPRGASVAIGSLIPFLELLGAILLYTDRTRMFGVFILIFLLSSFCYAIINVLKSKKRVSCGCNGRFMDAKVDYFTLGKAVYLLILILLINVGTPMYGTAITVPAMIMGTILTLLLFYAQKIWQNYSQTMERLRK